MITDEFWRSWPGLAFLLGPFAIICIGIIYNLHLIYRHLDAMLEALNNSRHTYTWAPALRAQGWIGSMLLIAKISGMILMPKASIKMGDLDARDLENFPPHLKRKLKIVTTLMIGGGALVLLQAVFIKL
jgi:hypothetical protein